MDKDQTKYKNRTLTHSLQQPSQEIDPLAAITSPGSQSTVSQTWRKRDCFL